MQQQITHIAVWSAVNVTYKPHYTVSHDTKFMSLSTTSACINPPSQAVFFTRPATGLWQSQVRHEGGCSYVAAQVRFNEGGAIAKREVGHHRGGVPQSLLCYPGAVQRGGAWHSWGYHGGEVP